MRRGGTGTRTSWRALVASGLWLFGFAPLGPLAAPEQNLEPRGHASAPHARFLKPCQPQGLQHPALCGTFSVSEDRKAWTGRRIPLKILVLPAVGPAREADPVFYLVGGPGQAATESAERAGLEEEGANRTRDIVLIDQRGTGGSNPLQCKFYPSGDLRAFLGPPPDLAGLRACREKLEKRADLSLYTTPDAAADLEKARRALGYRQINLDAGSYGTRLALVYMREYPRSVRSVILRGVSPTNFGLPLPFARAGQDALDRLFEDCAADAGCHSVFPDPAGELHVILERLERSPFSALVTNPVTGKRERAAVTRDVFASRLHLLLFSSALASRIPYLIHRASAEDFGPFAQLAVEFGKAISEQIYFGLQLSVSCSEDAPVVESADIVRETSGTFLGAVRVRQLLAFCSQWPRARLPEGYTEPVRSSAPTLLISGGRDPATPARFAGEVARYLPNVHWLLIQNGSHMDAGPCLDKIAAQFLGHASFEGIDSSCVEEIRRPPFFLPEGGGAGKGSSEPSGSARCALDPVGELRQVSKLEVRCAGGSRALLLTVDPGDRDSQ